MSSDREKQLQAILSKAHLDYAKSLNGYAFFKVSNHDTSEDLVQDTFIKTWSYLVRKGEITLMKAFLFHVLNDLIVDEYRKRKFISLDALFEKGFEPSTGSPEKFFNIIDAKSAVSLIYLLPEKYRRVMHMRYVQTLSHKEISLITGQSLNTIAVQTHRGLEKLRLLYATSLK